LVNIDQCSLSTYAAVVLIMTLHVHRLSINLLIKYGSKTNKPNTPKNKFIRYLCFIVVDFIHSCHHHLKMSSFSLKENKFWSIELTQPLRSMQPLCLQFLNALNTSFWKDFWSKGNNSHFENAPSFQICTIIKFSASDNAILAFWLVHWITVTSHYTCVWPFMEINVVNVARHKLFRGKPSFVDKKMMKKKKKKNARER